MNIMNTKNICPACGKSTDCLTDSLCSDCFLESVDLYRAPLVMHVRVCPTCGAHKQKNRWVDGKDLEEIIENQLVESLNVYDKAENVSIGVHINQLTPHMYMAYVDMSASVGELELYKDSKTEVRIKREACDMCSRRAGGYFEAVIQLRASNRQIGDEEIKKGKRIIYDSIETDNRRGDKLSFITEFIELKEGADFYVGSSNAANHASKKVADELGGTVTESFTLAGMKEGKEVYRTTFLTRLAEFKKGDVIIFNNEIIEVGSCSKRTVGRNLITGSDFIVQTDEIKNVKKIGNVNEDVEKAILVDIENDALLILDPKTFETVTVSKPIAFDKKPGSEILIFRTESGIVALN
ncbi:MAG: NMD protein affecting ribosome stability and mRNA decay [Methanosarcinaceae archaeon]|nr:NMD protein affecting ribosome stability and mRNA decay [Methanosarcinaceae archaeon]